MTSRTTRGHAKPPLTFETAKGADRWKLKAYTLEQVQSLPASVDFVDAARALGLSRSQAYEMLAQEQVHAGSFPVTLTKVGKRVWKARQVDLLDYLTRTGGVPAEAGQPISA